MRFTEGRSVGARSRIIGVVGVAGLCLALGAAPGNSASPAQTTETIKHKGRFVGIGGSRVTFNVVMKDGKPVRIKHLRYARYPVFCSGVRDGTEWGRVFMTPIDGRHFRRDDYPLQGEPNWSANRFDFFGKVKADGTKATGKMRSRHVDGSGDRCDTGLHRWKTRG